MAPFFYLQHQHEQSFSVSLLLILLSSFFDQPFILSSQLYRLYALRPGSWYSEVLHPLRPYWPPGSQKTPKWQYSAPSSPLLSLTYPSFAYLKSPYVVQSLSIQSQYSAYPPEGLSSGLCISYSGPLALAPKSLQKLHTLDSRIYRPHTATKTHSVGPKAWLGFDLDCYQSAYHVSWRPLCRWFGFFRSSRQLYRLQAWEH